jgi:phage terminase Nu1 subunit (DNA packaging protein)
VAGLVPARPTATPTRLADDQAQTTAMIQEGEQGKIVEVEDDVDHKTVEVWVE